MMPEAAFKHEEKRIDIRTKDWAIGLIRVMGQFSLFVFNTMKFSLLHKPDVKEVLKQIFSLGFGCLPIITVVSVFVGSNIALQGYYAFHNIGAHNLLGIFIALAGLREMAPVVAGSMLASKAGSEIASHIATMRIKEQIDALEVMAVNPYVYLVAPRIIAIVLVAPVLTFIADFLLCGAGYIQSVGQLGLNSGMFMTKFMDYATLDVFIMSMFKGVVFGVIITSAACFFGFNATQGAEGVGRATNRAVVVSAIICVITNYFISAAYWG